jgi:hypothetical protein
LSEQAFLVIVRNKKRVGYTYELTLKVKGNLLSFKMASFPILIYLLYPERVFMSVEIGEWTVKEEKRMVKGDIDFPEFSFGELDDLQVSSVFPSKCLEYRMKSRWK